jgi:hypothetical protein
LYVAFEGDAFGLRLRAGHEVAGHRFEHVYFIRGTDPLSPRITREGEDRSVGERLLSDDVDALVRELAADQRPPLALIIIDTVRASLTGSEDSSEAVSAFLRAVRRILTHAPTAAGLLVHHAGWQDGETGRKRERGSSAFRGNCDATLYLDAGAADARGEAELTLQALKVRDGERWPPLRLIRRRVEVPGEHDGAGQPRTSCVIDRDRRSREDREADRAHAATTADQATDIAVLRAMHAYPGATSISRLRSYVGLRTEAVSDGVARILRAGSAAEGKRGQPFIVTPAGLTLQEPP